MDKKNNSKLIWKENVSNRCECNVEIVRNPSFCGVKQRERERASERERKKKKKIGKRMKQLVNKNESKLNLKFTCCVKSMQQTKCFGLRTGYNTYLAKFSVILVAVVTDRHHFHRTAMNVFSTDNRHHCLTAIVPSSFPKMSKPGRRLEKDVYLLVHMLKQSGIKLNLTTPNKTESLEIVCTLESRQLR